MRTADELDLLATALKVAVEPCCQAVRPLSCDECCCQVGRRKCERSNTTHGKHDKLRHGHSSKINSQAANCYQTVP